MDRVHLPPTSWLVALVIGLVSPDVTARQEPASADRQEIYERLEAIARSTPKPEPLAGDRWIRGRVVTEDGTPLEGVLVRVMNANPKQTFVDRRAFADGPEDGSLSRSLRASASWWFTRWQNTWETTTAADGAFSFDHLVGDRFDLEAWRAGFSIDLGDSAWRRRMNVGADENVALVAYATVRHEIEVRMPDGSSPPRVMLQFDRVGGRSSGILETWTPDDPFVPIPSGEWKIKAYAGDPRVISDLSESAWFVSSEQPVSVRVKVGGERVGDKVVLALRGVPAIEGSLHVPASESARSFEVVAVALAEGEEPDPKRLGGAMSSTRSRDSIRASVNSGSQRGMRYRLSKIDPGRWFVGVREWGVPTPLVTSVVVVGDGVAVHDFTLPARNADSELLVRVFDPAGTLLRQADFDAVVQREDKSSSSTGWSGAAEARRTPEGRFAFARDRLGTSCTLFVKHPSFGTRAVDVPLDAKELEVKYEAPATPRLHLPGATEFTRTRRIALELSLDFGTTHPLKPIRTEVPRFASEVAIDLGRFQPCKMRLKVYVGPSRRDKNPSTRESEVASASYELASGPSELTLAFPELGTVKVSVDSARESYTLYPSDWSYDLEPRAKREAASDDDRILTFVDVPPGSYELRGRDNRLMRIEAPAKELLRFVADPVRVLRVVIQDPKGEHARAGLQDGDRVVAIDGREFESREELERIRQSLKGERVTLTVQRKEARLEIEVELRLVRGAGAPGGYLVEAPR